MFDTKHLVDSDDFETNINAISEYYHTIRHPHDCGNYESAEERENLHHEDIREQKRMMFQNILPLRT